MAGPPPTGLLSPAAVARTLCLHGQSQWHHATLAQLARVAQVNAEVLIAGPTGVGKELYARFVHACSRRRDGPFVALNCGAIPDTLLENELFGHQGGAYTGARAASDGLIAAATGGTLLLDEIDSLSLGSQVKLLRLLQDREFRRLGETHLRRADVRFVAATNADLRAAVAAGRFREDLYFRLRVVPFTILPLRDRPDDIPVLLATFIDRYAAEYEVPPVVLTRPAEDRLYTYAWPGNVRELENCVRRLTCTQPDRPLGPDDLPLLDTAEPGREMDIWADALGCLFQDGKQRIVAEFERRYLEAALRRAGGNILTAARASGKHRRAFFELLRKHNIAARDFKPSLAVASSR